MRTITVGNLEFPFPKQTSYRRREQLLHLYWKFHPRFSFFKSVPPGSKLLDVGAGTGGLWFWRDWDIPQRTDVELYAVDRKKGDFFDRYHSYKICDLNRGAFEYDDAFFDAVFMSHVLEHLRRNTREIFAEIRRILRVHGRLYIETPTPATLSYPSREIFIQRGIPVSTLNFFDDKTHISTSSLEDLGKVLSRTGFEVLQMGTIDNKYLERDLLAFGISHRDEESATYGIWSMLRWAQYVIARSV